MSRFEKELQPIDIPKELLELGVKAGNIRAVEMSAAWKFGVRYPDGSSHDYFQVSLWVPVPNGSSFTVEAASFAAALRKAYAKLREYQPEKHHHKHDKKLIQDMENGGFNAEINAAAERMREAAEENDDE